MKSSLLLPFVFLAGLALAETAPSPVDQAKAALAKNDLAAAEALLAPLAAAEKPDPAALHQLALVRLQQKRTTDAVALLEKATAAAPNQADLHAALGTALSQRIGEVSFLQQATMSGKLRKAFARAVELDPKHLGGLFGLARYYASAPEIAGGSLEQARVYALRIQELNPYLGVMELGQIALRGEDFAAAVTHADAAAKLQPKAAGPHVLAGRALAKLARPADARARLQLALELDPRREDARKALAALD